MIKRIAAFVGLVVIAALLYFLTNATESNVTVLDARAAPMGTNDNLFMVTMTLKNEGDAVSLTDVQSESGGHAHFMNPEQSKPLVVPANGQGQLAMDGAHMILSIPNGAFEEGTYQSVTLSFSDGSTVGVRVLRPTLDNGGGMSDHDMSQGVEVDPAPEISFASAPKVDAEGFEITVALEDFRFVRAADDAEHVSNEGHAHVYLNGLKLGRLYKDSYEIGALLPGNYVLRIALNSNDHRPYLADGKLLETVFEFQID